MGLVHFNNMKGHCGNILLLNMKDFERKIIALENLLQTDKSYFVLFSSVSVSQDLSDFLHVKTQTFSTITHISYSQVSINH